MLRKVYVLKEVKMLRKVYVHEVLYVNINNIV